jgi:hypothetical protein
MGSLWLAFPPQNRAHQGEYFLNAAKTFGSKQFERMRLLSVRSIPDIPLSH